MARLPRFASGPGNGKVLVGRFHQGWLFRSYLMSWLAGESACPTRLPYSPATTSCLMQGRVGHFAAGGVVVRALIPEPESELLYAGTSFSISVLNSAWTACN